MQLILASTSPYRREQLERLGLCFTALAPACDEEALKDPALAPQALAEHLALAKAQSLGQAHPEAVVIGADQVCEHQGQILGKPGSIANACAQLARLAGSEHRLVTALAVVQRGRIQRHTEVAILRMRRLDAAMIARYVERDRPLDCAGAYKLERAGIGLFADIRCADHSAITGLPLIALVRILVDLGVVVP